MRSRVGGKQESWLERQVANLHTTLLLVLLVNRCQPYLSTLRLRATLEANNLLWCHPLLKYKTFQPHSYNAEVQNTQLSFQPTNNSSVLSIGSSVCSLSLDNIHVRDRSEPLIHEYRSLNIPERFPWPSGYLAFGSSPDACC